MIISFSGRQKSGKTTLANIFQQAGFKKISFADKLRELVCKLYGFTLEETSDPITKDAILDQPLVWNEYVADLLAELIESDKNLHYEDKNFISIREALQYIGTEVLRRYDPDFHTKEFQKAIDPTLNYVCDDNRFLNEFKCIDSIEQSHQFYIIRPYYFKYSNHASENDLNRSHFNYVLNNNGTLEQFLDQGHDIFDKIINHKHIDEVIFEDRLCLLTENNACKAGEYYKSVGDDFSGFDELTLEDMKFWGIIGKQYPEHIEKNHPRLFKTFMYGDNGSTSL